MAIIYGWTYAKFHAAVGWDKGAQTEYEDWENSLSEDVNEIIFNNPETLLTDSGEVKIAKNIVHTMLIKINAYLRGDATSGDNVNLYGTPGFPQFTKQMKSVLNKLKKRKMTGTAIPLNRGGGW